MIANQNPGSRGIVISTSSQLFIHESEARAALHSRVQAKDYPPNEILVVTCGSPDARGYMCPADHLLFKLLWDADRKGLPVLSTPPSAIRGVVVHSWGSDRLVIGDWGQVPWRVPSTRSGQQP